MLNAHHPVLHATLHHFAFHVARTISSLINHVALHALQDIMVTLKVENVKVALTIATLAILMAPVLLVIQLIIVNLMHVLRDVFQLMGILIHLRKWQ